MVISSLVSVEIAIGYDASPQLDTSNKYASLCFFNQSIKFGIAGIGIFIAFQQTLQFHVMFKVTDSFTGTFKQGFHPFSVATFAQFRF
jgi:hypothetical protein